MLITKAGKIKWGADVPSLREHQCDSSAVDVAESSECVGVQRWAGAAVPGGCCYLFQAVLGKQSILNVWLLSHCCQL